MITGGSSGIGAATGERLAEDGFAVILGARRVDKLNEVATATRGRALSLDVTDDDSVTAFAAQIPQVDVVVNNAGLASGLQNLSEIDLERVQLMWDTNVLGLIRVTRALLPKLEWNGGGHIVNVGSIAGFEVYRGGAGYAASKHAVRALTRTLRLELLGKPVRVTEVAPGHVDTEFATVRFDGDRERAAQTYEGFTPLSAEDIADCIAWAVTRPPNVNVDEIVVRSISQAAATEIARDGET